MRELAEGVADPADAEAIRRYAAWIGAQPDAAELKGSDDEPPPNNDETPK